MNVKYSDIFTPSIELNKIDPKFAKLETKDKTAVIQDIIQYLDEDLSKIKSRKVSPKIGRIYNYSALMSQSTRSSPKNGATYGLASVMLPKIGN